MGQNHRLKIVWWCTHVWREGQGQNVGYELKGPQAFPLLGPSPWEFRTALVSTFTPRLIGSSKETDLDLERRQIKPELQRTRAS